MSDTSIVLGLFAVPTVVLLWAVARTQYRIARGAESGRLRHLDQREIAAGVAALAAAFGFVY
jgi:hypothetical protein